MTSHEPPTRDKPSRRGRVDGDTRSRRERTSPERTTLSTGPRPVSTGETITDSPRVARSKAVVLEAALDVLLERGVAGFGIEAVVERSGVAKTTIYRHWPSREALVFDTLGTLVHPAEDPDTGSLRGDLEVIVTNLAKAIDQSPWGRLLPSIIDAAERDPSFEALHRAFIAPRNEVVLEVFRRGAARGEIDRSTRLDDLLDLMAGALFFRCLVSRRPMRPAYVHWVIDVVIAAGSAST